VSDERGYGHVHHGEDRGFGAVAEVGVVDLGKAFFVFGHERPSSSVASTVFQADRTYKPKSVDAMTVLADKLFRAARP